MNDFVVTVDNQKMEVSLTENSLLSINGKKHKCELINLSGNTYLLTIDNKIYEVSANKIDREKFSIVIDGNHYEPIVRTALQEKASKLIEQTQSLHHNIEVKAPMPGMILKIKKEIGDNITQGDSIIILEAMKMENDLRAPASGTLNKILVKEGTPVEKGTVLFSIE